MKLSALLKMIVKEFRKDILLSILLLALIDFVYANFTGMELNRENGTILWQGGNDVFVLSLSTVLLKLLNVSVVFITIGKIADKLSSDIMVYLLARITDYRKFMYAYSAVVVILGEMLLAMSHIVYYCFAGFYFKDTASILFYLFMDCFGFLSIMILYIILSHCYSVENSFLYIIAVYVLNTILPFPILPAMATARFLTITSRFPVCLPVLTTAGVDLIAVIYYDVLIRKRRINVC